MKKVTFGTREMNKLLDDTLMNKYSFASETLMELAGVAIAQVSHQILKRQNHKKVCVLAGPGNNGGDGLVAARHLKMMKYEVSLIIFKNLQGKNGNFQELCRLNQIPILNVNTDFGGNPESEIAQQSFFEHISKHDLILDGIFGFPFTGQMRAPYKFFIPCLSKVQEKVFAIDIPSGWDANEGNIHNLFVPKYLISLGMPKKCSENFSGEHYMGGRFVPEKVCEEIGITLPQFPEDMLYTRL